MRKLLRRRYFVSDSDLVEDMEEAEEEGMVYCVLIKRVGVTRRSVDLTTAST